MISQIQLLGESILKNRDEIAKEVHKDRLENVQMTEAERVALKQFEAHLLGIRANFISLFGNALVDHADTIKNEKVIQQWGETNGQYLFDLGVPLDEALKDTSFYRQYLWKAIEKEAKENKMSLDTIFKALSVIDPLLDKAVYFFSLKYIEAFTKSLETAQSALLELSVPVVSIEPEVAILPLIGVIDSQRARLLMDETLKKAEKLKIRYLVLDMSGVLTVDTMVADQIFKLINALSIIGVKTIVTGIRPDVAQTVVSLGIHLNDLIIKRNPYHALIEMKTMKNAEV